jgi:penicillin-binding protein 1A
LPLPVAPCLDVPAVKARASRSTNRRGARVDIANRRDGGVLFWILKLYGFAFLIGFTALGVVGVSVLTYFLVVSPKPPDLSEYSKIAPGVSRMYAADGTLLGEFAKEWRELVPFEKVPKPLVNAFLAVEDHEFFEHRGIYFKGIVRARSVACRS